MADARADVVIKINVNDADAKRKLAAIGAELTALGQAGRRAGLGDVADDIDDVGRNAGRTGRELDDTGRRMQRFGSGARGLGRSASALGNVFSSLGRFVKFAGIEFGIMTVGLGALKLALVAADLTAKGFQATLRGLGAAAGVAIGGLATVLAAVRELQNARMAPLVQLSGQNRTGPIGAQARMAGLLGDPRLGMFKDATLTGAAQAQMRAGGQTGGGFRDLLGTLGNFAVVAGDPDKALAGLAEGFIRASEAGKFTEESFRAVASASPDIVKGFEKIYGGERQLQSALRSGKVTVDAFMQSFESGTNEALTPFIGALDRVNNTVFGRFKSSVKVLKEQLTEIGNPFVQMLDVPMMQVQRQLQVFLMKVTPTIQRVFAQILPGISEGGGGMLGRMLDALATSINTNMPKLIGFGERFLVVWNNIKNYFRGLGDTIRDITGPFDNLWNNIVKPLGSEIAETISFAFRDFGQTMDDLAPYQEGFKARLDAIFDGIRNLIAGFNDLRKALAPIIDSLTRLLQAFGALTNIPIFGDMLGMGGAALGFGALMMRRRNRRMGGPNGGGGPGLLASLMSSGFMMDARQDGFGQAARGTAARGTRRLGDMFTMGGFAYDYARQGNIDPVTGEITGRRGRIGASGQAVKEFWKEGGKSFSKVAAPAIGMAAMAAGGIISSKTSQTSSFGQGLGSALSMAGTGAMIGTMVGGPVGTAVGAGVGALIGLGTGVMGARSAQRERRQNAREAATEFSTEGYRVNQLEGQGGLRSVIARNQETLTQLRNFGDLEKRRQAAENRISLFMQDRPADEARRAAAGLKGGQGIFSSFNQADTNDRLRRLLGSGTLTGAQRSQIESYLEMDTQFQGLKSRFDDTKEAAKQLARENTALEQGASRMQQNYKVLSNVLDLNNEAAANFATRLNVDLKDAFLSVEQIIEGIGYTSDASANLATAAGNILKSTLAPLESDLQALDAEQRFNAAGDNFFRFGQTGESLQRGGIDFFSAFMERETGRFAAGEYGSYGDFRNSVADQFAAMRASAVESGLGADFLNVFDTQSGRITGTLNKGMTDFGTRMQFDPTFALGIRDKINAAGLNLAGQNLTTQEQYGAALRNLVGPNSEIGKFLTSAGIQNIGAGTLETMIASAAQSSGAGMVQALEQAVLTVKLAPNQSITPTSTTSNVTVNVTGTIGETAQDVAKRVADEVRKINRDQIERK